MEHVMPRLLEQATTARDEQSRAVHRARAHAQQAVDTLARLDAFRAECLARTPAATLGRADGAQLADTQRFLSRLDDAIRLQRQESVLRDAAAVRQQQLLVQAQQRLLALQALAQRQADERRRREARRGQAEADEFAARASGRGLGMGLS